MQFMRLKQVLLCSLTLSLVACTATQTLIGKRHLQVQTKMSHTIFLEPVAPNLKTVYLQLRNTSGQAELDITSNVSHLLQEKGYKVVSDPTHAHFLLQANILSVGRNNTKDAYHEVEAGYGSVLGGAAAGAAIGSLGHHHHDRVILGGLAGAAISSVTDAMVDDITFNALMDVQISERQKGQFISREKIKSKLKQGNSGYKKIESSEQIPWKRYQTRIISSANQVNLKFQEAQAVLSLGLAQSVAGIF